MKILLLNIEKIRAEMLRLGITQYELAKRLKVSPSWVYTIFKNHKSHSLKTVSKIADIFNCDPKDILKQHEE